MRRARFRLAVLAGLASVAVLSTCSEPLPPTPKTFPLTAIFVAPHDGEVDVPTTTRVWVRASDVLAADQARAAIRIATDTGEAVAFDAKLSEDRQGAVLVPSSPLQPARAYVVTFLRDAASGGDQVLSHFTTRPSGTRSQDGFQAKSFLPMDVPGLSVWPFTTFRVLLSEPVRPESILGQAPAVVRLVRVSTGEAVPVEVLVKGRTVTIDPVTDLAENERYRIELAAGIQDLAGEALTPTSMEVQVKALAPMRNLSLALGPTPAGDGGTPLGSRLEAVAPNTLELNSSLAGSSTLTLSGTLAASLPDPGQIGQRLPMVIRKGQTLTVRGPDDGGLLIRLGGAISTTLNSGPLSMTLITDASGEISENPLRPDAPGARPLVRLSMDAALTAANPTVSTMLTQNLLGLQLVGSLYVQEGKLGVELVGGVELDLLGLDTAASSVTIGAWSADQATVVSPPPPALTPRIFSPDNNDEGVPLDRPLLVVFSAPPDGSERGRVWLERAPGDGVLGSSDDVATSLVTDGAMVLLRSRVPLDVGASYTMRVAAGVRGVDGSVLTLPWAASFHTRDISPTIPRPTAVGSLRPGMPCAFFDGGVTRQCSAESPPLGEITIASDLPVEAHFTKPVDASSIRLGKTVDVREADGGTPVVGHLNAGADWFQFIPDQPWQVGRAYVLRVSGADGGCGQGTICDVSGQPVNTDLLLDQPVEAAGGAPIVLPFSGGAPSGQGGLTLSLVPASDSNANGQLDLTGVPPEVARPENSVTLRDPTDGGIVDRTYLVGTLLSEVGRYNPATGELPLTIDEGSWLYGTNVNMFGITTDRLIIQPTSQQVGTLQAPLSSDTDQRPILTLPMTVYMHSVIQTVEQALPRAPLVLALQGRLRFTQDGRMVAAMTNTNTITLDLIQGRLQVLITPGDVQVTASSGVLGR